jgi:hypothetical protein
MNYCTFKITSVRQNERHKDIIDFVKTSCRNKIMGHIKCSHFKILKEVVKKVTKLYFFFDFVLQTNDEKTCLTLTIK